MCVCVPFDSLTGLPPTHNTPYLWAKISIRSFSTDSGISMKHSCQKTWQSAVENGQQTKRSQRSSFSFRKTTNHQMSHCTLMAHPSPNSSQGGASMKCWGAWDTTCGHKAKDTTPSIAWRKEAWEEEVLDDLPWNDDREPSLIRQTLELSQRQRWRNLWETGWSTYGLFRANDAILDRNKLNIAPN